MTSPSTWRTASAARATSVTCSSTAARSAAFDAEVVLHEAG